MAVVLRPAKTLTVGDRVKRATGWYTVVGVRFAQDHPKTYEIGLRYTANADSELHVLKDVDPDKEFVVERL